MDAFSARPKSGRSSQAPIAGCKAQLTVIDCTNTAAGSAATFEREATTGCAATKFEMAVAAEAQMLVED